MALWGMRLLVRHNWKVSSPEAHRSMRATMVMYSKWPAGREQQEGSSTGEGAWPANAAWKGTPAASPCILLAAQAAAWRAQQHTREAGAAAVGVVLEAALAGGGAGALGVAGADGAPPAGARAAARMAGELAWRTLTASTHACGVWLADPG